MRLSRWSDFRERPTRFGGRPTATRRITRAGNRRRWLDHNSRSSRKYLKRTVFDFQRVARICFHSLMHANFPVPAVATTSPCNNYNQQGEFTMRERIILAFVTGLLAFSTASSEVLFNDRLPFTNEIFDACSDESIFFE